MHVLAIEREGFLTALMGESGMIVQPQDLRVPLHEVLRALPPFEGIDARGLRALVSAGRRELLPAGTVVFETGDPSSAAYVILQGRVEPCSATDLWDRASASWATSSASSA